MQYNSVAEGAAAHKIKDKRNGSKNLTSIRTDVADVPFSSNEVCTSTTT